jgi:hypothetical protein
MIRALVGLDGSVQEMAENRDIKKKQENAININIFNVFKLLSLLLIK